MPRPPAKRSRLASQSQSIAPARNTRPTRQDVLHANGNSNSNSDDSDGLVTAVPALPNSSGIASREAFMSGGLGKGDTKNAHKTNQANMRDTSPPSKLLESAAGSQETQQAKSQTPVAKSHEQAIESSPIAERVATGSRPPTRARGYSSTLSLAGRKGDMSSRIPGTPAFESSILSNFRRRPRQPSILQMMQADGSSDLDDDDDFLGGLSPEDESTPLNLARKSLLSKPLTTSPSTPPLPSSGSSRKRKRAPEEVQVPQSPPGFVEDSPRAPSVSGSDEDEACASREGLPAAPVEPEVFSQTMALPMSSSPVAAPREEIIASPGQTGPRSTREKIKKSTTEGDEKAAEPHVQLSTAILQEKFLPRRRRHRRNVAADFDFPSDESEEEGRHHGDIGSDDDDELSYLPSRPRRRALAESKSATNANAKVKSKRMGRDSGKKGRNNHAHGTNDTGKSTTATASSAASTSKVSKPRDRITYSSRYRRHPEGGKENQLSDTSSPLSSPPASEAFASDAYSPASKSQGRFFSEELELQAKKFAEVDKWQMEFEDVIVTGNQDSPFR